MQPERISGTLAAAVTPLREAGDSLDEEAFTPLFDFYRASGIDGLLVLGTTDEGILLTAEERRRVAELSVAEADGLKIIVHSGAQTTAETSALSAHAAQTGADGVAVIAPPYYAFEPTELVEHFASAAVACAPLPFYVYEYAARSGYAIPIPVLEELRDRVPNFAGLKVSDASYDRVRPYIETGLDVFIGSEPLIRAALADGAVGIVSGVAAAFPEPVAALVRDPDAPRAAVADALRATLAAQPFQASVKAALGFRGVPVHPDVRAPLRPLAADAAQRLRDELERLVGGLVHLAET